jgi:hypothetical protein
MGDKHELFISILVARSEIVLLIFRSSTPCQFRPSVILSSSRTLLLTNPDGSHGPAAYGLLEVVPPATLGPTPAPVPTIRALAAEAPVLVPNLAALGEFAKSAGRSR